jgi:ribosomal-protein-alanine N-acetyltransferase
MAAVYTDPVVMRYIPGGPLVADAVEPTLARHLAENARGLGFYAVEERSSGAVVGEVGFAIFETGERELGWTLAQAYWGRGYATEAARACLAPADVAVIDAENAASIRVAGRLGLSLREERMLHGRRHLVFWTAA